MLNIGAWTVVTTLPADGLGPVALVVDGSGRNARARQLPVALVAPDRAALLDAAGRLRAAGPRPGLATVLDVVDTPDGAWIVTEHVPSVPASVLAAGTSGTLAPQASVVHHILVDSAEGCLALAELGLAYGALSAAAVSVGADGVAHLSDPCLLAMTLQQPRSAGADAAAWAAMARGLRERSMGPGDLYGEAVDRAVARAAGGDLRGALDDLRQAGGALAGGGESREALRVAVVAFLPAASAGAAPVAPTPAAAPAAPAATWSAPSTPMWTGPTAAIGATSPAPRDDPPPPGTPATAPVVPSPTTTVVYHPVAPLPPGTSTVVDRPPAAVPPPSTPTVASRPTGFAVTPAGATGATVTALAESPASGSATGPPAARPLTAGGPVVAFGGGPPPPDAANVALAAAVARGRDAAPPPRRRSGGGLLPFLVLLLIAAAIAIGVLILRRNDTAAPVALTIQNAEVSAGRSTVGCGDPPVVFTARVSTNAVGGVITYRWERADGTPLPSGTQSATAGAGAQPVTLELTDEASGRGRLVETARLHVLTPTDLVSKAASYVYTCP